MSSLQSRLPVYLIGLPLSIWIVLIGGWAFKLFVVFFMTMAFIEFLSLRSKDSNFIFWVFLGICYVCIGLSSLLVLRSIDNELNSYFTLMLFCGVTLNDTFAYIFGSLIGGKKIAPSISPNKTYAGLLGGLIGSIAFILLFHRFVFALSIVDQCIFIFIFSIIGFLGDLLESFLKRQANVKDSSRLLMGHGGALDRVDSLILTSPLTLLYVVGQYL
ncbi:MAG TPA: phosphatidate cytidylyltransferase [Candidatus Marinimicrobia bacterium]|jgi:phosphatidate cytidylyltransferase|nr:phosphatidate cytidylyltransferase [Candidatus Neomarinimicrobiota bacterium]|tara:strand:- start:11115 stop:11762 length:648 start_codon:yes stop_codon:yes gene_type:complete